MFKTHPAYSVKLKVKGYEDLLVYLDVIHDSVYPDGQDFYYFQQKTGEQHLYKKSDIIYIGYSAEKMECIAYWRSIEEETDDSNKPNTMTCQD